MILIIAYRHAIELHLLRRKILANLAQDFGDGLIGQGRHN
jgi:hypothetical protein